MNRKDCPKQKELDTLFSNELSGQYLEIEQHLEQCSSCRSRIESMAGDPQWWSDVTTTLADLASREIGTMVSALLAAESTSAPLTTTRQNRPDDSRQLASRYFEPPVHPEMLGRIGRFDVESLIGRGGFGTVWKAWDSELNRPVAIKMLAEHLASNGTARKRFVREAQSAAAVTHPNVVPIHAVHGEAELPWLVMGFVAGNSLEDLVRRSGPLELLLVVRLAVQVAEGLQAAHEQGLVHRDIKPANILVESGSSRALITDFGLARAADDASITQTGWLAGTPHYMSPEQARGADIDVRSDLFSLGSVLYFLATGRQAFRGDASLVVLQQIGTMSPLPPRNVNSNVPQFLSALIMRLLEKDPRDRFESAGELHDLLQRYLAHLQHPQSRRRPRLEFPRRSRRRILGSMVAVGAVSLGFLAWWLTPHRQEPPVEIRSSRISDTQRTEVLELSQTWDQFRSGIRDLEADILALELPIPGIPEVNDFLADDRLSGEIFEIEKQLRDFESGTRPADPPNPPPFRPEDYYDNNNGREDR